MPNILKGFRMVGSKVIGPVIAANDPYFNYTTLLLPGSGSNGANNNVFVDASTNNFAITRNGNTTQGTFSPFSQTGWSNYFDGSGDYLSLTATSAVQLTNSTAFAIEFWVYPASIPSTGGSAFVLRAYDMSSPFPGYGIAFGGNTLNTNLQFWNGTTWADIGAVSANTWTHVAVTYEGSGTTLRYFINGTQQGSATTVPSNINYTGTPFIIGARNNDFYLNGYLSNLRIVKGSAVYTSNFTPSTTPLTAITNTSLLTCQSNRFIDNSTNAFTITRNGDVSVQAFSPFAPAAAWSAATYGGSGYFDGTGDYLATPSDAAFGFGTGDYTIEGWVYSIPSGKIMRLLQFTDNGDNFELNSNGLSYTLGGVSYYNGTTVFGNGSAGLVQYAWNHIVLQRTAGTVRVYVNALSVISTGSTPNTSARTLYIGGLSSDATFSLLSGYLASFRIVKGSAVYSGTSTTVPNFTLPTAPLSAISNTSLLLNFTNAGIYDATGKNNLETVGDVKISTTTAKFGSSSMYFDGNGDYLQIANSTVFDLPSIDYTIEFWMNPASSAPTTQGRIYSRHQNSVGVFIIIQHTTGAIRHTIQNSAGTTLLRQDTTTAPVANTWTHVAVVRFGNTFTIYLDGTASASNTAAITIPTITNSPTIGVAAQDFPTLSAFYNGYLQDLRITKGYARYTANFTPATAVFPVL